MSSVTRQQVCIISYCITTRIPSRISRHIYVTFSLRVGFARGKESATLITMLRLWASVANEECLAIQHKRQNDNQSMNEFGASSNSAIDTALNQLYTRPYAGCKCLGSKNINT